MRSSNTAMLILDAYGFSVLDSWRDKLRSLCYQKSEVDRALQIVQGKRDFGSTSHVQFLFPAFKGNSSKNWQCIG